jgi:hypothetical protein
MPHPFRELVGMVPAESPRRRPAKIVIPGVVTERDYDLVCIGSPMWWLSTDVPVRSFLQSDTASRVLNGKPFTVAVCCRRGELERRIDRALGSRLQRPHSAQPPNRVIPPATQRSMAERAGSTITEIAGSHVSLVSHPGAAIDAILAAVAAIGE